MKLFARRGFDAVTVAEVAKRAADQIEQPPLTVHVPPLQGGGRRGRTTAPSVFSR